MNTDDQTLAVAVSTLALAVFMTLGVALSGADKADAVAQSGYGVDADSRSSHWPTDWPLTAASLFCGNKHPAAAFLRAQPPSYS